VPFKQRKLGGNMKKSIISFLLCSILFMSLLSPLALATGKSNSSINNSEPQSNQEETYIIKFKNEKNGSQKLIKMNKKANKNFKHLKSHQAVKLTQRDVVELRKDPNIEYIEKDSEIIKSADLVNQSLHQIHVPEIQRQGLYGEGVKVAVMDTGISLQTSELRVTGGISFVPHETILDDLNGHGTYVAGILAALKDGKGLLGVAPRVELYNVKVLDASGTGRYSGVIQGLEWAIDNQIDVVVMSFAGSDNSQALKEATKLANENGILLIAAAGNDGINQVSYPAQYDSVIAVGAVDGYNQWAPFSNTGEQLELVAPGVNIQGLSLHQGYITLSGTSASVPHVAGIAALLKEKYPSYNAEDIRLLLRGQAIPLGDRHKYGYGLVDALGPDQNPVDKDLSQPPSQESPVQDIITLDYLSQTYNISSIELISELNKGYTLQNLLLALKSESDQSLTEKLKQINPLVIERNLQYDYSAERFADEPDPDVPVYDVSVTSDTYGQNVTTPSVTEITYGELFSPLVDSPQMMGISTIKDFPTSYDQFAVKRMGIPGNTAPFSLNNQENVSLISGAMQLQTADLFLPGRNGLSFSLKRRYDSSNATYYDKEIFQGNVINIAYYPALAARLSFYPTGQSALPYGQASDFYFSPWTYNSFVQFNGYHNYWEYPGSYPIIQDFNDMNRKNLEKAWRKVDPDDPNSSPFIIKEDIVLDGIRFYGKAYTTGRAEEQPFSRSIVWTYDSWGNRVPKMAYGNRTKSKLNEENRFPIGKGWSWDIPFIETTEQGKKFIHLFGGASYEVDGLNLKGYPWKDLTLNYDTSLLIGSERSYYVLTALDGKKQHFNSTGQLIQISDLYNNTIQFEYKDVVPYGKVLTKVSDAIGNEINISYSETEVFLTMGDRTVRYEKTKDPKGNKELLSQITDPSGRKTQYIYEIAHTPFDLVGNFIMADNYSALLKQVYHPTMARTDYIYESTTRSLGIDAKETVYRVKSKDDVITYADGTEKKYNHINYTYYGDGAAASKQSTSFSTVINNGRTNTTYAYDKVFIDENIPEDFYNTKIIQTDGTTQHTQTMEYDRANRRPSPIKITSKTEKGTTVSQEEIVLRAYDEYGNITSETDPNNIVTTYNYNSSTHLLESVVQPLASDLSLFVEYDRYPITNSIKQVRTKENDANGLMKSHVSYQYDAFGNPSTIKVKDDNRDIAINFTYGSQYNSGFPTSQSIEVTDADDTVSTVSQTFNYKMTGEMTKIIDAKGDATQYEYDSSGRVTKVIHPDLSSYSLKYDDLANQVTATDETGIMTIKKWNPLGLLTSEGIIGKEFKNYEYDAFGRLSWTDDGAGLHRTYYQYDPWDRLIRTDFPGATSSHVTIQYDDINRIKVTTDSAGNHTKEARDILGHVIKAESFNSPGSLKGSSTFTYDFVGNVLTTIDGNGHKTSYSYDVLGRLISVTDPEGNKTSYRYSLAGNLEEVEYPDRNKLIRKYDQMGRIIQRTGPLQQIEKYYYDNDNNEIRILDPNGQIQTLGYNNRNFLISNSKGSETITFNYDNAGRRLWMQDATGRTSYGYEVNTGWLSTITYPDNRIMRYSYDNQGKRIQMTDPFGIVTVYEYDEQNRLEAVGPSQNNWEATYSYNNNNLLSTISYRNGITSTLGYDEFNLKTLTHSKPRSGNHFAFSYGYDANRNISDKTENAAPHAFTYDKLNRIEASTHYSELYTYDNRGNRLTLQSEQPVTFTPTTYQYDERDRLTQVNKNNQNVTYRYNGDGLLYERILNGIITRYYYDGGLMVAEGVVANNSATHKASYIRGTQLVARVDANGSKAYYLHNGHGDVVGLTDGSGNLINEYSYDIWGNPITTRETIPNPFRYSGEFWDSSTNLQYLRARWYDPSMGRFINEDTYEGDITNPLSLNLYTYVHNNPLKYIDPTGHWCTSADGNWSHAGDCDYGRDTQGPPSQEELSRSIYSDDSLHRGEEFKENGEAVGVFIWGLGSIRYGVDFNLGVKGWSYRLDKVPASPGKTIHMHIDGPKGQGWSQNDDGSTHDDHKNSPGDPPKSMRKEVKKKTGWDWDAKAKSYKDKQNQIEMLMQEASMYYPEGLPENVLYGIIESVQLGRPSIPGVRIPRISGVRPVFIP
jgi:RHS repeat-associated protein